MVGREATLRIHKIEVITLPKVPAIASMEKHTGGWKSLPPDDLPSVTLKPTPTASQRQLVIAYERRQCASDQLRDRLTPTGPPA